MKQIRKLVVTLGGALLLIIGILMVILPGPALIIIPVALLILNTQYPEKTRLYIRKFQRKISKLAVWMDKKIRQWS